MLSWFNKEVAETLRKEGICEAEKERIMFQACQEAWLVRRALEGRGRAPSLCAYGDV